MDSFDLYIFLRFERMLDWTQTADRKARAAQTWLETTTATARPTATKALSEQERSSR